LTQTKYLNASFGNLIQDVYKYLYNKFDYSLKIL